MSDGKKPSSVDCTSAWERARKSFLRCLAEVETSQGTESCEEKFGELIACLESYLASTEYCFYCQVFCFVAEELFYERICLSELWDWLRTVVNRTTDDLQRDAISIACFEPMPEEPINWADLDCLFSFLDSEDTVWAVFYAYDVSDQDFPKTLRLHYAEYVERREQNGLQFPEFPEQLLQAYLSKGIQL